MIICTYALTITPEQVALSSTASGLLVCHDSHSLPASDTMSDNVVPPFNLQLSCLDPVLQNAFTLSHIVAGQQRGLQPQHSHKGSKQQHRPLHQSVGSAQGLLRLHHHVPQQLQLRTVHTR